jgi:alpha-mannosidase
MENPRQKIMDGATAINRSIYLKFYSRAILKIILNRRSPQAKYFLNKLIFMSQLTNLDALATHLRDQVQRDVMAHWRIGGSLAEAIAGPPVALNEKRQVTWPKGKQECWLYQAIELPLAFGTYALSGMTVRLALTWWADQAIVYVNGVEVQAGDLFDHSARVLLCPRLTPGERFDVALHLVSPVHDGGALMRSRLVCEDPEGGLEDPGFVADELAVVQGYVKAFEPDAFPALEQYCLQTLDCLQTLAGQTRQSHLDLPGLRAALLPWSAGIKQHHIALLGHAHLDMAWLWPIAETWEAAERTFVSVLKLQKDFPELTFCHTTPALYEWMELHRPELFAAIQTQVKAGKWEVLGGMWIEPEVNLIGAESMARQILYGQKYYQSRFGAISPIAWLPDTFGFPWQLPQLLRQGGMTHFVTQKLRWNDTNPYPHEFFRWQSPDGTSVKALMSAPIGEGIDPIKLADYSWQWRQRTAGFETLWLPGVGDHGGGPTRDMLEIADRWSKSSLFPNLTYSTAAQYLQTLDETLDNPPNETPVWNGDLYLEFHRGCYSTHRDQKVYNHRAEVSLYQAELWSSLASLAVGSDYPYDALETAWKQVLFNQFHDILPGTSIPEVYAGANPNWEAAILAAESLTQIALQAIAAQIQVPHAPQPQRILFNSCAWDRQTPWGLVPALGYLVTDELTETPVETPAETPAETPVETPAKTPASPWILENEHLKVVIDPATGAIASLIHANHEYLRAPGNQLQFFQDQDQYWDAWNIDPSYANHPLAGAKLTRISRQDSRGIHRLTIVQTWGQSTLTQTYVLEENSPYLRVETTVDWQERHVLLKVAFPLNLTANVVTYDAPAGVMDRPTTPNTPQEKAQWEVPAISWASLHDDSIPQNPDQPPSFSLLSPSIHGYDHQPSQLRLTLLRGSEWPDPEADRGLHQFTYALYPHSGDWRKAQTQRHARELSHPLQAIPLRSNHLQGSLPAIASLLHWKSDNLDLLALKATESRDGGFILRCYETQGRTANLTLGGTLNLAWTCRLNLLESPDPEATGKILPWTIATFGIQSPN